MRPIRLLPIALVGAATKLLCRLLGVVLGVVLGVGLGVVAAAPAGAVSAIDLRPGALPRGADVAGPHLEGHTVVDGDLRLPVQAGTVDLLGRSGPAYVVATGDQQGGHGRVLRILADGTSTPLVRAAPFTVTLSADGSTLAGYQVRRPGSTELSVWSATTGALQARRTLSGFVEVLDVARGRVLLGSYAPARTLLWTTGADRVRTLYRQPGYAADLSTGLLARFSGDPFRGGCTLVSRLAQPATVLWRSCRERVDSFSTDGSRIATIDKLSDGIGPSRVTARLVDGTAVGRYDVPGGWFGQTWFESPTALLLPTNGARQAATVRCVDRTCERASSLGPRESPRTAPGSGA